MKWSIYLAVLCLSLAFVSASDYGLNSVNGIWTSVSGGSSITGVNTNEVRWGTPTMTYKSGLRFDGTATQDFNEGDEFLLGTLTHFNWPVNSGTAANSATLKIALSFNQPPVSPDPDFIFSFDIEETPNTNHLNDCPSWQESGIPCDDKITFPDSYGQESYQIGDKLYTLKILGFQDSYPSGNPISEFITQEQMNNQAYLVGTLSSVLIEAPQITLVEKATNSIVAESAPGPEITVGDTVEWTYIVQNTGNVQLSGIAVIDNQNVTVNCPQSTLQPGDSMTCTASGVAELGQYENTAYAFASYGNNFIYSNDKTAHYLGVDNQVPEFGVIAGTIALISALGIIAFKRK